MPSLLRVLALAATLVLPCGAGMADMDGRYKLTPDADCDGQDGAPGLLRIEDGVFFGAESTCRMLDPVVIRDMDGTIYDMLCTGDGAVWQERAIVVKGAEGELILVWDGYAFAYPACPKPPVRPRGRPRDLAAQ